MKTFVQQAIQDARYAVRMLWKSKLFTLAAVLCLAVGIGGNTAIFSVVRAVLLRPLPFPEPDAVVALWERSPQGNENAFALPNFDDLYAQQTSFEALGAMRGLGFNLTGVDRPERVTGAQVTAGVFETVQIAPDRGRWITTDDDRPGAEPVVVVSHSLGEQLPGDEVVGTSINLDGRPYTVVGVAPPNFSILGRGIDVWVPLGQFRDSFVGFKRRGTHPNINAVARLTDGTTLEQAKAELDAIAARIGATHPETNEGRTFELARMSEELTQGVREGLLLLFAAVGLVLLIASANIASLLLARGYARTQELAVRRALGASAGRLMRQLLTESVVLGLLGGAAGLLVAAWGMFAIGEAWPEFMRVGHRAELDPVVLAFTAAVAVGSALLFGLAPALWAAADNVRASIVHRGRLRLQGWLTSGELALAMVLLTGAGMAITSLHNVSQVELGFEPQQALSMRVRLDKKTYSEGEAWRQYFDELSGRVQALPGVTSTTIGTMTPMYDYSNTGLVMSEDDPVQSTADMVPVVSYVVGVDYFKTLGIRLQRGRVFDSADMQGDSDAIVVDTELAERFWPGEDPIGKRIGAGASPEFSRWMEVVGVVEPMHHFGVQRVPRMMVMFETLDTNKSDGLGSWGMEMSLIARSEGDLETLADAVRAEALAIDPGQPIFSVEPLEQIVNEKSAGERTVAILLGLFAVVALGLAAVGLYGVMGYSVTRRTRELGIRIALGATAAQVRRHVMRQAAVFSAVGLALGIGLAVLFSHLLESAFYQVNPLDPIVFGATAVILFGVAMLAAYLPARRATAIDPVAALRRE